MSYEYSEDVLIEQAIQDVLKELGWQVVTAWQNEINKIKTAYNYIEPETLKVERKQIRFYDEREWRFIPTGTKPDTSNQFQTIEEGAIFVQQMNLNQSIEYPSIQIPFEEIEYIIIGKKKETVEMVKQLRLKFGRPEMERLIPKLISAESIIKDF